MTDATAMLVRCALGQACDRESRVELASIAGDTSWPDRPEHIIPPSDQGYEGHVPLVIGEPPVTDPVPSWNEA